MAEATGAHLACLHHDSTLPSVVGPYLMEGIDAAEAIVIVATPQHREAVFNWLATSGCGDLQASIDSERIAWLDAHAVVDQIVVGGRLESDVFARFLGNQIDHSARVSPVGRVRVLGELANVLVADRNFAEAARIELLASEILRGRAVSLCCAYASASFRAQDIGAFRAICDAHTDLLPDPAWRNAARSDRQQIAELEIRARALELEVLARQRAEDTLGILAEASATLAWALASDMPRGGIAPTEKTSPILIWASGPDKLCNYFNEGWLTFTGRGLAQELGNGWAEGVHPEDLERCVETYVTAFDRRAAFRMEYRLRRADGEYRRILDAGTPRFAPDGTFCGYIGGCIDVTESRAARKALDERHARLERVALEWTQAFDSLDLGVVVVDETLALQRLNRAAFTMTEREGYDQVIGTSLAEIGEGEPWSTALALLRASGEDSAATRSARAAAFGRSWDVSVRPLLEEHGESNWMVVTVRETTEMERLQAAVRSSEKMAAIGTLMTGVAHEVRNPLSVISGALDLFDGQLGGVPVYQQYGTALRSGVGRLMSLMQDLLDYARPPEPVFLNARLADIVDEAVDLCQRAARSRGVEIRSDVPRDLAPLRADRRRLGQVFENVVSNAVAFSPRGSTVRVEAHVIDGGVRCDVKDSGPGFALDDVPHLFEPFFTRRREGTGLGLSIARRIVEAHAGSITATNDPAGGGIIRIILPRRDS